MGAIGKLSTALLALGVIAAAGCAAGKVEARREQQQALVRELAAGCAKGQLQACSRAETEKRVLFEVFGCHCKDSPPADHKPIWSGG